LSKKNRKPIRNWVRKSHELNFPNNIIPFSPFSLNSGVHHKKKLCEATKVVKKVQDILVKAKSFLFPIELKVTKVAPIKSKNQKNPKGNGGWGDHRDQALCLNMASAAGFWGNRTTLSQEVIKDLNV
jgi:hypothetical protein